MEGQTSLFDLSDESKSSASTYKFQRYIGQKVKFWRTGEVGVITEIEPYYTTVATEKTLMAGTPTTIVPMEE